MVGLVFLFLVLFVWQIIGIVVTFFLAFILFSTIKPVVDYLEDKGINRSVAITLVYLSIVLFFLIGFYFITSQSWIQIKFFAQQYLNSINQFASDDAMSVGILGSVNSVLQSINKDLNISDLLNIQNYTDLFKQLVTSLSDIGFQGFRLIGGVLGGFLSVFMIMFLSVYMVGTRKNFYEDLVVLLPIKHRTFILDVIKKIQDGLSAWVKGMLLLMLSIGVGTYIIILIPSLFLPEYKLASLAFLLALIAGLLEAIPNLGPILTYIVAVIFAIITGSPVAIFVYITVSFFLLQQAEAILLVPVVMKKAIDIHPIVSILSVLAGLEITGSPLGALLSIPIAGTVQIIILEVISNYKLFHNEPTKK